MDGLIDSVQLGLAIWDATQTGTRQQTQTSWDDTSLVANDVTEQVAGNNNTVQRSWVLDHKHSRRVDEVGARLEMRVLVLHDALEGFPP
jgi:hypothetical protein